METGISTRTSCNLFHQLNLLLLKLGLLYQESIVTTFQEIPRGVLFIVVHSSLF